jgi:hypothetical protein
METLSMDTVEIFSVEAVGQERVVLIAALGYYSGAKTDGLAWRLCQRAMHVGRNNFEFAAQEKETVIKALEHHALEYDPGPKRDVVTRLLNKVK